MTRISRKTYGMRSVTAGTDKVIGHAFLPQNSVLHGVSGAIHVVGQTAMPIAQACMVGLSGWVASGFDPDTQDSVDDIYDRYVPKDEDVGTAPATDVIDLDTTTPNTATEFEPGEPTVEALIGLLPAGKFWDEEVLISFANSKGGFDKTAEDMFPTTLWDPFVANVGMRTDDYSAALLSIANPAQDDVTATVPVSPPTAEWIAIQYVDDIVESAWKFLVGLTEAGAETPFSDLANILQNLTEPTVHEESAGSFVAQVYRVWARLTWNFEVEGSYKQPMLSSG